MLAKIILDWAEEIDAYVSTKLKQWSASIHYRYKLSLLVQFIILNTGLIWTTLTPSRTMVELLINRELSLFMVVIYSILETVVSVLAGVTIINLSHHYLQSKTHRTQGWLRLSARIFAWGCLVGSLLLALLTLVVIWWINRGDWRNVVNPLTTLSYFYLLIVLSDDNSPPRRKKRASWKQAALSLLDRLRHPLPQSI